jgi:hypothetical protein
MTTKVPFRIDEIDLNNIVYTDMKSNNKKIIIYIKYNDNNKLKNLVFQTPTILSSNNIQCKNNIFEIDIPLICREQNKTTSFINFLTSIDKKIVKDAKNNNKWFERYSNVKTMKYQKIIRSSDEYKNGVIRLKLLRTNEFETIVHLNNNKINIEEIIKDCWLKSILEVYAIWINENGFGLFIRPILLSFKPCMKIAYDYKFVEESEDENNDYDIGDTNIDTSIFVRNESEITSSVLEMPKNTPSSEEPVKDFDDDLNSTTSSDH